ncbi:MAG TPA: hypothetical protein VLQ48_11620 [Chloroflexia bacterium]|jgi:hypothetical protein|nr:hypothetical protein [Chloroflexia bacterium]
MTDAFLITTTVTIVLALAGYMAAYLNGLRLAQRNQRLERVNKQLGDFYGPLYGLIDSETAVFKEFRNIYRPGKHFFSDEDPPTDGDLEAWRLWMTTVFAPINNRMYELVLSQSDLLIETEMPQCLRDLCAHVVGYHLVIKKWESGDYSEKMSLLPFPRAELLQYVGDSYNALKREQARLLGKNRVRN